MPDRGEDLPKGPIGIGDGIVFSEVYKYTTISLTLRDVFEGLWVGRDGMDMG